MRHIILISGKDSLWTAVYQQSIEPDIDYEFVFNDTMAELPETYEWLQKVESYLGKSLQRIGSNLEDIIDQYSILPSRQVRFCTRDAKIKPFEKWLGKSKAVVYYGIRADEHRVAQPHNPKFNITAKFPLIEGNQTILDVYNGLSSLNLLPPAFEWTQLIEMTKEILKENSQLIENLHPVVRRYLFSWRSRTNCYFCFFQRQYEWIGLYDNHPNLFQKACEFEENYGSDTFKWLHDMSLKELLKRRDLILYSRARVIAKSLLSGDYNLSPSSTPASLLEMSSCGLLCGK